MSSKVYFIDIRKKISETILLKIEKLFLDAGFNKIISANDLAAIKIHFGEKGNLAYLRPAIIRTIINLVKSYGGKPFLTDCNVLYKGSRNNAIDHIETANFHGFSYGTTGAPIIIADGLDGKDYVKVKINLKHFNEVNIGSAAVQSDCIFSVSHFKAHEVTGFGGTIKNIGMGFGSRSGKQLMHADVRPTVDPDKCSGDEKCLRWCPTGAITMRAGKAFIDSDKCIGCAECVPSCRFEAISIDWSGSAEYLQEKMVEYFYGVIQNKKNKTAYINIIMDVSPECDCYEFNNLPIVPNIGIVAASDPVAIDQCSVDLVNEQEGIKESRLGSHFKSGNKFRVLYPNINWEIQLKYAEKIGLGTRKYELIKL